MGGDTDTLLARAIQEHLELKERNAGLDEMPLDRYTIEDPFENHPLFKSEEQARLEETLEGVESPVATAARALPWPGEDSLEGAAFDGELWSRSRDFDWGR